MRVHPLQREGFRLRTGWHAPGVHHVSHQLTTPHASEKPIQARFKSTENNWENDIGGSIQELIDGMWIDVLGIYKALTTNTSTRNITLEAMLMLWLMP